MYGAKGTTFINTVARQSALSKQLATVHATNKTSAFISTFPARSGKLYTTSRTLNNTDSNSNNNKDQHLNGNPFAPLARASSWTSSSSMQSLGRRQQQLRFQSALAHQSKEDPLSEEPNARILELARYKNHGAVLEEFMATKRMETPLTTQTYQAVMESYGFLQKKNQPLTAMMGVYDEMVTRGVRPTSETYALVIRSLCARDAEVNRASNVIRRQMDTNTMPSQGSAVQLHAVAHDTLMKEGSSLSALESENNIQRAVAVFEHAVQQNQTQAFDVELYNTLLRSLSYAGNTQDGLYIYEHLENAKAVRPNGQTFAMLMSMFGTAGDLKAVRECFQEYKTIHRALPKHDTTFVYNALVFAHVSAGDLEGALRVVEDTMVKDHVPVTIASYNKILHRATVDNNMALVTELLSKLKSNDHLPKPDANTYGMLLTAYSRVNRLDLAQGAFEELLALPLHRQYGHITEYVSACLNQREYARSMDVVRAMAAHGLDLHVNLCCKVLSSHVDGGDMAASVVTAKELLQLYGKSSYVTATSPLVTMALNVAERSNNLVGSLDILHVLNFYSVKVNKDVSDAILKLYAEAKTDPATWSDFVNYSTESSFISLYDAAFKRSSSREEFTQVVFSLLDDMHALKIASHPGLYIRVSTRLNRYGAVEDDARWKAKFGEYYPDMQSTDATKASSGTMATEAAAAATNTTTSFNSSTKADMLSGDALKIALGGDFDSALKMMKDKIIDQGMIPTPEAVRDMIQLSNKSNLLTTTTAIYNLVADSYSHQLEPASRRSNAMYILYNNMLIAHARQMDLPMAKLYYDKLRHAGMYPDGDAYGCLLTCTANDATDESLDAMVIYEEAKKHKVRPTVYFYNVIISKLARCRKMDQALELFKEMRELGVMPNSVTYASVISACIRCSSETRAVHYFEEMTQLPRYQPRIGVYNSMIQFYVQQRTDRDKALEYFHLLKQANLVPSAHTYKLLIEAYANIPAFDMVAAHNLLGEMKKRYGLNPGANHYATLMKSYGCFHRDVDSAQAVYSDMLKHKIKPNELVYQAMIETYIDNNRMPDAEKMYANMAVPSSPYIENLFIKGYGLEGNLDKAEQVFDRMDVGVREPSTYEAMVKVYMEQDKVEKAKHVLEMMTGRDFPAKVVDSVALLINPPH